MFDYLQKFNSLPKDLRDQVSSPSAMAALADLENKYQTDLAMTVMKVMIKSLKVSNLAIHFVADLSLGAEQAQSLAQEMTDRIFSRVADYLDLNAFKPARAVDQGIGGLIKECGLSLPSENLVARFRMIISTYLKGIRNKIDTRAALAKDAKIGGLNLTPVEVDRVLQVCEKAEYKNLAYDTPASPIVKPATSLDKIVATADTKTKNGEYNLKQALANGQIKKPAALDPKHEIAPAKTELDLPRPIEKPATLKPITEAVKVAPPITLPVPPAVPKPVVPRQFAPASPVKRGEPASPVKRGESAEPVKPAPKPAAPAKKAPEVPSHIVSASRPAPAPSENRPQMHDIKPMPKVMGPLEELQYLDIVNFRRLGKTPTESAAKVFAKIKLLEDDGYDKMVLGVQAWRQSLVNRLYLALVSEAVNQGRPLQTEIDTRLKANPGSLTWEEIQAIMALNSKLVF